MSPHVGNFVADLVEMAKATETLPNIQAELDATKADNESLHKAVQAREEAIARYKAEIDALHAKIRDTEAQRDDAELRFHEGQDRTRSALDFIKSTFGSAGSLIQALEPPAQPEPVKAEDYHNSSTGEGMAEQDLGYVPQPKPIDNPMYGDPQYEQPVNDGLKDHPSDAPQASQGQSEPLPTDANATHQPILSGEGNSGASTAEVSSEGTAAPQPDPTHSVPVDTQSLSASPTTSAIASTEPDDVGYHNEPNMTGTTDWSDWDKWAARMTARYGVGQWPIRPSTATA